MILAWWQIVLGVIVGLVILTVLVIVHELGHAVVAKRNGVDVEEFGIGFPPRAKEFGKVKGTLVTLNWLPLGGFCKMKGENDDATGKGTYGAASLRAKAEILLAGVTMNFLLACLLFAILALFGIPRIMPGQFAIASDDHGERGTVGIYSVVRNSPAERAGLKKGDRLVSVAGKPVGLSSEVPLLTKQNAGRQADIVVIRDGKKRTVRAKIGDQDNSGRGRLGIQTTQLHAGTVRATWSAPIVGVITAGQFFRMTLSGLVGLIGADFPQCYGGRSDNTTIYIRRHLGLAGGDELAADPGAGRWQAVFDTMVSGSSPEADQRARGEDCRSRNGFPVRINHLDHDSRSSQSLS